MIKILIFRGFSINHKKVINNSNSRHSFAVRLLYYAIIFLLEEIILIEVKDLVKSYGGKAVLKNIYFSLSGGGIHGILGAVGSGKSTLADVLCGVIVADSGKVRVCGIDISEDPVSAKSKIGYLPQTAPFYDNMTVYEYLTFVGEAKSVPYDKLYRNLGSVMELTDITDLKKTLIKKLSHGQKQRLGIAQTMLGNPEIIILDEPFASLGDESVVDLKELIKRLGEVKTVVFISKSLQAISELCDDITILSDGEIIAQGGIDELERKIGKSQALCLSVRGNKDSVLMALDTVEGLTDCTVTECKGGVVSLELEYKRGYEIRDAVFSAMAKAAYPILSMETRALTLGDVYLKLTADARAEENDKKTEKKRGKGR